MGRIRFSKVILNSLLGAGMFLIAFPLLVAAQVKTQTSENLAGSTRQVTVERGEIVYLKGRTVVIRMGDGELKSFENVPESTSFIVDGKPVNIHTAKVGMVLERQTIKTTMPKVITTVETVTGKVWHVTPPKWVVLTLQDGTQQQFNIPNGQKFMIDGKETDVSGLRKGMTVTAQRVTEVPMTVVTESVRRTGTMPAPPPAVPNADLPLLVVVSRPAPPPPTAPVETASAEPAPKALPKTASNLPLIGLLGALICAVSLTSKAIRANRSRYGDLKS
jgi:hypothetical protein